MANSQGKIATNSGYIVYDKVQIGKDTVVEPQAIIGMKPHGKPDHLPTIIGKGAVIRAGSIIYHGNRIGDHFQTGMRTTIREANVIGNNVSIGSLSMIEHHVVIEDNVRIHSQAFIPEYTQLKTGCWIGPQAVLTNAPYPGFSFAKQHLRPVIIEADAKVGANATILPGIVIGAGALIAAGAVVTKDVAANQIMVGSPARSVGQVDEKQFLEKLLDG